MKLSNFRYEKIKEEVADLLQTYNVNQYPFRICELASKMSISLKRYDSFEENIKALSISKSEDSFVTWVKCKPFILYNNEKPTERKRFNIAHEIAHIWLEHQNNTDQNEAEANFFAAYLLAPTPLIIEYDIDSPYTISSTFWISKEAGQHACTRARKRRLLSAPQTSYEYCIVSSCSVKGDDSIGL